MAEHYGDPSPEGQQNLKGTLINKQRDQASANEQRGLSPDFDNIADRTIINRDGGEEYTVKTLRRDLNRITLAQIGGSSKTITLDLARFEDNLKVVGGPWRLKDDAAKPSAER